MDAGGGAGAGGSGNEPNSASSSIGTVQIGSGNSASDSIGTFQAGAGSSPGPAPDPAPGTGAASIDSTPVAAPGTSRPSGAVRAAARQGDKPVVPQSLPGAKQKPGVLATIAGKIPSGPGALPFTGFGSLSLLLAIGFALLATGLGLRAFTIAR
jgi:hypothetical protein